MTDKMFDYMSRLVVLGNHQKIYKSADVTRGDDLPLAMNAQAHGWLHIEPYNTFITSDGFKSWLSEKDSREDRAEEAAAEDRKHLRQTKLEFRFSILSAAVGGLIALFLEHIVDIFKWAVQLFEKSVP